MSDDGTRMASWEAWRAACAFERTPAPEREEVISFLARRFHRGVGKAGAWVPHRRVPEDADCATLFESWCALHPRQDGKAYKRWLFARGDRSQGSVESGISLLMRKVVREWLRLEAPRWGEISLQHPLTPEGLTLEHLLPEGRVAEETLEEAGWRAAFLRELRPEITPAQWVALCARHQGLPFRDPEVLAAAGEGHTALHKHNRELVLRIAARVKRDFPEANASDSTRISLRCLEELVLERKMKIFADKTPMARCMEGKETP